MHSQKNCYVPGLSVVRFGPGGVYFDQTYLMLGNNCKCVIIRIGNRLLFCTVQRVNT